MSVDIETNLSDLVTADSRRARVLEKFGLDYCCHGQRPLGEAAADAGVDIAEVTAALDIAGATPATTTNASTASTANAALAHDIVDMHHAYMWAEMPRLRALVAKVHSVHGARHPELADVHAAFEQALSQLEPHMTSEERVVFPAISRLEKSGAPGVPGLLAEPIAQLRAEHDVVGELFKQIRALTGGYAVPGDACNAYRAMLGGLEEMELDLHEHIHKENNVLFPRAVEMERRLAAETPSLI
jgi:regulator of cell morphogenesis and NO signaling